METNLRQLHSQFISECRYSACLRDETIRGYKNTFDLFEKIMPEITTIDLLSSLALTEFFKRIETRQRIVGKNTVKTGVKKSTIKTYWSKLDCFFKWLEKKQLIAISPLDGKKSPRVNYDDFRRLEDKQINKIYSAIISYSDNSLISRRDTLMVSILLYTGVRKGEFISLQVKDLDFDKKLITIRGETSKSKKTKVLPIHPTLLWHLKEYLEERKRREYKTEYLIVSSVKDKGLSREGLKHWVDSIIKKSGVKFHLHQFRHTFACKLTENGTPSLALQKLMGHTSISMTAKYTRSLKSENMNDEICKISI
jgi:site-specific recombinase XerD